MGRDMGLLPYDDDSNEATQNLPQTHPTPDVQAQETHQPQPPQQQQEQQQSVASPSVAAFEMFDLLGMDEVAAPVTTQRVPSPISGTVATAWEPSPIPASPIVPTTTTAVDTCTSSADALPATLTAAPAPADFATTPTPTAEAVAEVTTNTVQAHPDIDDDDGFLGPEFLAASKAAVPAQNHPQQEQHPQNLQAQPPLSGSPISQTQQQQQQQQRQQPHQQQSPPKPPPPPPKRDLDEVWTPFQDSSIQGCLQKERTGELLTGTDAAMAAVLFGVAVPDPEKEAREAQARGVNLLEIDEPVADQAASASSATVKKAPWEEPEEDEEKKPKGRKLDLSDPAERAAAEAAAKAMKEAAERERQRAAAREAASSRTASSAKPIPTDARGFGSDDLFGPPPEDRGMVDHVRDEAAGAYNFVKHMLPEHIQTQMPECTAPPVDEDSEIVIPAVGGRNQHQHQISTPLTSGPGSVAAAAFSPPPGSLQEQHEHIAAGRAHEGRWVPTYMRQQLAANGHSAIPSAPNGHETRFNASAPPPNIGEALNDMGTELGETAQSVFDFFASLLSTFTVQCQVCSVQSASTIHEQVLTYGENLCQGGAYDEEDAADLRLGEPVCERLAGLGPVRSSIQHIVPGVTFQELINLVKSKLITGSMPTGFSAVVNSREVTAQAFSPGVEDFMVATALNPEALPEQYLDHLCKRPEHSLQRLVVKCRESWHIKMQEQKAIVEMSNFASEGPVLVTLRMTIAATTTGPSGSDPGCSVESKLFARRRVFGEVLPIGICDSLDAAHRHYAAAMLDVIVSSAQELGAERQQHQPSSQLQQTHASGHAAGAGSANFPQTAATEDPGLRGCSAEAGFASRDGSAQDSSVKVSQAG